MSVIGEPMSERYEHPCGATRRWSVVIFGALTITAATFLYFWVTKGGSGGLYELTRSQIQIISFPILLYAFYLGSAYLLLGTDRSTYGTDSRSASTTVKLPFWIFIVAICGALSSSLYVYIFAIDKEHSFLIAEFLGENREKETRIFRERMSAILKGHSVVEPVSFPESFNSNEEIFAFLRDRPAMPAIVSGHTRWLTISFPGPYVENLATLTGSGLYTEGLNFELVTNVPQIGLSYEPSLATSRFVAFLMEGVIARAEVVPGFPESRHLLPELPLRQAGSESSHWTSGAHRALPWFLLGNRYFIEALRSGSYEPALLRCSYDAWERAKRLLLRGDNPELLAAVYNNQGIAGFLDFIHFKDRSTYKWARARFRKARLLALTPNPFGLPYTSAFVAERNLGKLFMRSGKLKKRKGRHGKKQGLERRPSNGHGKGAGKGSQKKEKRKNRI